MVIMFLDVTLGSTAQGVLMGGIGIKGIVRLAPQDRIALVAILISNMLIKQMRFHALPAST